MKFNNREVMSFTCWDTSTRVDIGFGVRGLVSGRVGMSPFYKGGAPMLPDDGSKV